MDFTLVTGACGGLGTAFCKELAQNGEALVLTGRSEEKLRALAASLEAQYGAEVRICACDLTDSASREALFAFLDGSGITLSRLVYCAGADNQAAFEKYGEEKLVMQTRVNFEGAVSLIRGTLARRREGSSCEILAVGSVSGLCPMPYFALYSATKRALEQFCAGLRMEEKGRAKITCVLPGAIYTREDVKAYIRTQGLWGKLAALPPEKVARRALKAVKKNRRRVVIGFWNKLLAALMAAIPTPWKLAFIAKKWRKTEKWYY